MKRELKKVLSIYCGNISGLVSLFLGLLLGFWRPSHVRPSVQTLARTLIIDAAEASDSAKAFVHHLRDFFPSSVIQGGKGKGGGGEEENFPLHRHHMAFSRTRKKKRRKGSFSSPSSSFS